MKINRIKFKNLFAILSLAAFVLQIFSFTVTAQFKSRSQSDNQPATRAKNKMSPDMEEFTSELEDGFRADAMQRVIITLETSLDLDAIAQNTADEQEFG